MAYSDIYYKYDTYPSSSTNYKIMLGIFDCGMVNSISSNYSTMAGSGETAISTSSVNTNNRVI